MNWEIVAVWIPVKSIEEERKQVNDLKIFW
jgi:hypothetical protein